MADDYKLKEVLINLIGNAIKFRKIDVIPEIEITVLEKETEYLFAVNDNGIGIEPECMQQIFSVGFTTKSKGHRSSRRPDPSRDLQKR